MVNQPMLQRLHHRLKTRGESAKKSPKGNSQMWVFLPGLVTLKETVTPPILLSQFLA
jgi:hypothetical protein